MRRHRARSKEPRARKPRPEPPRRRRLLRRSLPWVLALGLVVAVAYWPGMLLLDRYRERQRSADELKLNEAWTQLAGTGRGLVGKPWLDARLRPEIRRTAADIASRSSSPQQRYRAYLLLALCSQMEGDSDAELRQLKLSLAEETHSPLVYELLCRNALLRSDLRAPLGGSRRAFRPCSGCLSRWKAATRSLSKRWRPTWSG